jgi:hypothetical protein
MKTYLSILRLRWKLWGIFGFPFFPNRRWRVELHQVRKGQFQGRWAWYNHVNHFATRCLLGFVSEMSMQDAVAMAKHQALDLINGTPVTACPCAQYPDAPPPTGAPSTELQGETRICSACGRQFLTPPPSPPRHEMQYAGSLLGIVCTCGWTSLKSPHALHLPKEQGGTCQDCFAIHEAFGAHLATTKILSCPCWKWKEAPPDHPAAGICGKCNRSCFPGIPADDTAAQDWPIEDFEPGRPSHSGQKGAAS